MSNQASEPVSLNPPWRIGVDVGGTFTDMVLRDASGAMHVFKVPSVPADPGEGVVAALGQAADRFARPLPDLLRDCALFVHGSTVATNTMLERKGATVGLLTTEGFRDSLEIRRGIRIPVLAAHSVIINGERIDLLYAVDPQTRQGRFVWSSPRPGS